MGMQGAMPLDGGAGVTPELSSPLVRLRRRQVMSECQTSPLDIRH